MLRPGIVLSDRYEIIEKVGSGGMSDVYKARCTKLNRYVAVKVLKDEFKEDKTFVSKFRIEAQSAASLSHQNIVNVYDVGNDDEIYYIVMEYVEGITLKEYIQKMGQLGINEAINIAIQIASGIEEAHKNHIIHRDIKPQNIIISKGGTVKVTDFGIAKASTSATITANTIGSVHYISPEQARGGYIDEKSDVYSLGITIYEMVTGQLPYEGDNNVSVALLHIQGQLTKPKEIRPEIPDCLESIILKATQRRPELRYASAGELMQDLKKVLIFPDEDFVKINNITDSPTILMTDSELELIKNESQKMKEQENLNLSKDINIDKDDIEEETSTKTEKLIMILGVVAALLVVGIGSFLVFNNIFKPDKVIEAQQITVPLIEGRSYVDAEMMLTEKGLTIEVIKYVSSNEVEKDHIIEQQPAAGTLLDKDSKVSVIVSTGPQPYKVPYITGMQFNDAEKSIVDSNLIVEKQHQYDDTVPMGVVIRQYPEAGTELRKGDTVVIIVSNGKEVKESIVPSLKGLTEEEARTRLIDAKLQVNVTYHENDKVGKGLVISQNVQPNEKVPEGYLIEIAVSLGQKEIYEERLELYNVFEPDKTQGVVKLELTQNSKTTIVYEKLHYAEDFPLTLSIKGEEGEGIVRLFVDNVDKYQSWTVTFGKGE